MSILVGGGIGTVMMMNVWMIIWPLQKKIIAATIAAAAGTPAPADQPKWARRAFLASRTNAWLSVPMLFFMGAASHLQQDVRLNGALLGALFVIDPEGGLGRPFHLSAR
jgi:uncharacterized membrane protein